MVYAFQWTPLRSQFTTLSVSRHRIRSCSIARERRSAISIYRFLHKCQTNLHEKFQRHEFHTTEEKVFTKLTSLAADKVYYYSYFIHSCSHSHTLTIATGGTRINEPVMKLGRAQAFVNTFSSVVQNSWHWNFSCKFVWHLCRNQCMDNSERHSCLILQLRILCRLMESVINCERSGVHWKAYTISCVCRQGERA